MSEAKYMPGTKFQMFHYDGPDAMHQQAMYLGIGLIWDAKGDAQNDPEHYTETFEIIDQYAGQHQSGLTRTECENYVYNAWCEEEYK